MIVSYHSTEVAITAHERPERLRGRIAAAAAWGLAVLALLGLCYVAAVADLSLGDMPDEVSTMMGLPAAR